jgi:hypothetical protein
MPLACKVYVNGQDVQDQLSVLGIKLDWLRDVVRHIALTMNSHTDDHPSWGPGITTASEAVFALRSIFKPHGWLKEEEKGFALTVSPTGNLAINIAKGDEGTGDPNSEVRSVSDKGICTELALQQNNLFTPNYEPLMPTLKTEGRSTWYLIYARKVGGYHAELSLPLEMSESRHLIGWAVRIILPINKEDGDEQLIAGLEDRSFEVDIRRKSKE